MYIIRLSIGSKGKGKSGGARVLTLVKVEEMTVLLFAIYDKSIKDTLSTKEIQELINNT
ncbi:type II toxin-antitoxin system RelE/ParE family toxin [Cardinium endosymbiont of Culicoides punctatus]|uniref:type II toxin-antitoxin system RelE/ParE family toxin n=1 Tax=Cardinium endosymbiont of Culicoides punctatus TaxID=2304601 RepID=UPI002A4E1357|nr:type II toxin-antitoxin system RelE/ParE family toxin [Cardinium endosymbiont of Culicoides punctatus]